MPATEEARELTFKILDRRTQDELLGFEEAIDAFGNSLPHGRVLPFEVEQWNAHGRLT
ncbi:MAG: hypothetical protein SFU53_09240 [Terrimicrobiaceae bacterium]|nr:hypothetical protein [Terrimicrobiaceae bacterium]